MKKIMIAGTMSGSGKTTASSILMSVMENVAPFKVGPDYIDPGYHEVFTGNKSYNLDAFMHDEETLRHIFEVNAAGKGIAVVEGVMGLYDGIGNGKDNFSTAHVSRILDIPVILVVNARGISTSIAAEILGFKLFDERVKVRGAILNNVSSEKLYRNLKEAVEEYTGVECLGFIPRNEKLALESRHLGLKQALEMKGEEEFRERRELFKEIAEKYINIGRIYEIADEFEPLAESNLEMEDFLPIRGLKDRYRGKKMAIARDDAFSFYYGSNLDLIRFCGIEIVEFSPIRDKGLPENVDMVYLGGGYPELYWKELSENSAMKESIRRAADEGIRIYAECGGFIYLTRALHLATGEKADFCGIFDIEIAMKERLNIARFGYVDIECDAYNRQGTRLRTRGHEFHYSTITEDREIKQDNKNGASGNRDKESAGVEEEYERKGPDRCSHFYTVTKKDGRSWKCGYRKKGVLAGYPHISFYSDIEFFIYLMEGEKR